MGSGRLKIFFKLSPGPVIPTAGAYGGRPSPLPHRLLAGPGLGLEDLTDLPVAEVLARDAIQNADFRDLWARHDVIRYKRGTKQ